MNDFPVCDFLSEELDQTKTSDATNGSGSTTWGYDYFLLRKALLNDSLDEDLEGRIRLPGSLLHVKKKRTMEKRKKSLSILLLMAIMRTYQFMILLL
jgi:hypothetical protein